MPTDYDALVELARDLQRAEKASLKTSQARAALPPGSSRARVTTANARWATKAEARERVLTAYLAEHARLIGEGSRTVRELLAEVDKLRAELAERTRYDELNSLYEELQRTELALDKASYFFEFDRAGPPVLSGDALATKGEEYRRASKAYHAEHERLFGGSDGTTRIERDASD